MDGWTGERVGTEIRACVVMGASSSPSGNLEWLDKKKKDRCYIMWRSPEEWGSIIYQWVGGLRARRPYCQRVRFSDIGLAFNTASPPPPGHGEWFLEHSVYPV